MQTSGRVEYMFVSVGEEIEIKLTAQHLRMLPSLNNKCSNDLQNSAVQCEERCYWRWATQNSKCRGPWMPDIKLPLCNDYDHLRQLITDYRKWVMKWFCSSIATDFYWYRKWFMMNFSVSGFDKSTCNCKEPCNSIIYSSYIMSRGSFMHQMKPSSQVYLYYTTKMVAVSNFPNSFLSVDNKWMKYCNRVSMCLWWEFQIVEERPGYDGSQFLADIGGSLGFLLGLSVLGFIGILEKVWKYLPIN